MKESHAKKTRKKNESTQQLYMAQDDVHKVVEKFLKGTSEQIYLARGKAWKKWNTQANETTLEMFQILEIGPR